MRARSRCFFSYCLLIHFSTFFFYCIHFLRIFTFCAAFTHLSYQFISLICYPCLLGFSSWSSASCPVFSFIFLPFSSPFVSVGYFSFQLQLPNVYIGTTLCPQSWFLGICHFTIPWLIAEEKHRFSYIPLHSLWYICSLSQMITANITCVISFFLSFISVTYVVVFYRCLRTRC